MRIVSYTGLLTTNDCLLSTLFCSVPYTPGCLAPYGGPVEPGLAFGGAQKEDFTDSTAIGLTFLVKNHLDERDLQPALLWEQK